MDEKFTTMAQEAIGDAVQSASAAGNPQVGPLHLLDSLLRQDGGVVKGLIQASGADAQKIGAQVRRALVSLPSASGSSTAQPDASRQLAKVLLPRATGKQGISCAAQVPMQKPSAKLSLRCAAALKLRARMRKGHIKLWRSIQST